MGKTLVSRFSIQGTLIFVVFFSSAACFAKELAARACSYKYSRESITINQHRVSLEYYLPLHAGPSPLVLLLHSAAGAHEVLSDDEPSTETFGEKEFASACFAVVLPHYLEAIGVKSLMDSREIADNYAQLVEAIVKIAADVENRSWARGQPVFICGQSLGAYLGITVGLERKEVAGVSEISGGLATVFALAKPHRIHLLIQHGIDDSVVPVSEANALQRYSTMHGLEAESILYPGVGHYLNAEVGALVIARSIAYFQKQLGQ